MKAKGYSVRMIGLLLVGFLTVPLGMAYAQAPIIQFDSPAGEPRHWRGADPIDPSITLPVEITFPIVYTQCVGENSPVITDTLEVTLVRTIDGTIQDPPEENMWQLTTSGWTWTSDPDHVSGSVTIGVPTSGHNRSRYGLKVCIDNAAVTGYCVTGGWVRVEHLVDDLENNDYGLLGNSFNQSAGCGLIESNLLPTIDSYVKTRPFGVFVPSADEITADPPIDNEVDFLAIPLLENISMIATLNGGTNNVDLAEVSVSGTDLGALDLPVPLPPGYNCVISGNADGILYGPVSPGEDLDGEIRLYGITLETGSGQGECTRDPTGCELLIKFDGNPVPEP